jgi:hypothetical protein
MGWIEEKMGKKSGDTVPSRYLDSKFKKVTQEIKHYRYLAHKRTCVRICVSTRNCGLSAIDRNATAFRATASSFLITSLSGWGGGMNMAGGGEGGCTCILCIPPGYATAVLFILSFSVF